MFSDLNVFQVAGRLGRDPQVKVVGNGNLMTSFSLANRYVYSDELYGYREETSWLYVVAWGEDARLVQSLLRKGDHITVYGRISVRTIKDEESGATRSFTQVVLESFQKNDRTNLKRQSGQGNGAVKGSHPSQHTPAERFDDALQPELEA
ncbi:MAG TPA: single-stranded DNA-binding protein [Chloroflexia bacterium]|nr:single-stranded DNA-binding protein [Chloroflexia bacterium]